MYHSLSAVQSICTCLKCYPACCFRVCSQGILSCTCRTSWNASKAAWEQAALHVSRLSPADRATASAQLHMALLTMRFFMSSPLKPLEWSCSHMKACLGCCCCCNTRSSLQSMPAKRATASAKLHIVLLTMRKFVMILMTKTVLARARCEWSKSELARQT